MPKAVQAHSTFLRDLQAVATTAALMARLFPRWKGDAEDGAVIVTNPRRPAPSTARVLEVA